MGIFDLLKSIGQNKRAISELPAGIVNQKLSKEDIALIAHTGLTQSEIQRQISEAISVSYERETLYRECANAAQHTMISAALSELASSSTNPSPYTGNIVWITSDSDQIRNNLNSFLDSISLDDRLYDLSYSLAMYGDMFWKIHAQPGIGIVSINDGYYPADFGRVEKDGRLVGFYSTELDKIKSGTRIETSLIPPWGAVHYRIQGFIQRRTAKDNQNFTFATQAFMTNSKQRLQGARYGTSYIADAIPSYKRLRLIEDSLLLTRVVRGIERHIWKVKLPSDMSNAEASAALLDEYRTSLKRQRSLSNDPNNPSYRDNFSPLNAAEEIILPVFGDVNDISLEKISPDPNLKWIADYDKAVSSLATALKMPIQFFGGMSDQGPSSLGVSSLVNIDIRFARQVRRVQRAVIAGITRLCQIHLAYQGMNPSTNQFAVRMNEVSTAEESEIRETLEKGSGIVSDMIDLAEKAMGEGNVDKIKLLNYLNQKVLTLEDFDADDFKLPEVVKTKEAPKRPRLHDSQIVLVGSDVKAPLPEIQNRQAINESWTKSFGDEKITIVPGKQRGSLGS